MRQRNARAEPIHVPDLGAVVPPGGEIYVESGELLAGFEPVYDSGDSGGHGDGGGFTSDDTSPDAGSGTWGAPDGEED